MNSDTEDQLYDVEKILDYDEKTHKFLVKWTDYEGKDSWEPIKNLNCPILISQYFQELNILENRCKNIKIQTNDNKGNDDESFIQIFKKGRPKDVLQPQQNYDPIIDIPYKIESINIQSKEANIYSTEKTDLITVPIDWLVTNFPSLINQYFLDLAENKVNA